jgi:hypothetical protein
MRQRSKELRLEALKFAATTGSRCFTTRCDGIDKE